MSRCFPFPPPGYEAKPRSEHKDLLKKENHKAKKHKKEKTDGGKRERKEKDRGYRKDKHKKKHKREKHKDRREKKERDKDKRQNLELGTQKKDDLDNRRPKQIVHNEAVKYSKHKEELATQITGQEGHANRTRSNTGKLLPRSIESFGVVGSKEKERTSISRVNGKSGQIAQHNHASEKGKNKTRILSGTSLQLGSAEKRSTRIHGSSGVGLQQDSSKGKSGGDQGIAKIKEAKANHQKSVKDGDKRHGVNQKVVKDRDRDCNVKKRKAKDGNEGKTREKRSAIDEQKHRELDGDGASKNYIHDLMDLAHLNGNKFTSDDVKKRKGLNANSSLHDHHSMPMAKMPRTSPANHLCVNGEMLKHSQRTAPTLLVGTNPCEAGILEDSKECIKNGMTGLLYLEEHNSAVCPSSYGSSEVSLKPAHPDTKYLSQLYSVPAADDRSEYIDQDWLFPGDRVHQKTTMLEAAEAPQVWAEAQLIDSAGVVALPYVVPL
ncbi:unnamed protein product [Triticum turgidum subsp. durum]|uniref:Uncharacterized protein n=1 Tax=Triticum turgidum subsp. durum TaxID=4567 RepID=A0A9R0ZZX1_TRITD|nr:unnamed protein product [Triticum turgidum subsp. durum]